MTRHQPVSARLTWHVGSVLPYASLWHTVRRAAALNTLRALDLFNRPAQSVDRDVPTRMGPILGLLNESTRGSGPAVPLERLANWLGEVPTAFRWSHFGGLPPSMRCLLKPAIRLCPACIAVGYHSALFSLVLLRRCPIHGCELVDRCPFGHPLSDRLDAAVLQQPAVCDCGRAAFFTRQTCRRPVMSAENTTALQPVVDWLDHITAISRPSPTDASREGGDEHFLRRVADWCELLGISYPACFETPPRSAPAFINVSRTSPAAGANQADADAAAASTRAAFSRHLRRHVAPRARRAGHALMEAAEPLAMAARMRANPAVMVAFAMLVLAGAAEPGAPARRWPHRLTVKQAAWIGRDPRVFQRSSGNAATSNPWLAMHAAEVEITQLWQRAQLSAMAAVRSGIADWRNVNEPLVANCIGQAIPDGQRFASMSDLERFDWTCARIDKSQRRKRAIDDRQARHAEAIAACQGPALIWCPRNGWKVEDAAAVAPARVDRLRLLGVVGCPWIWVFQQAGHFVARGRDFPVLARGDSPKAAIDALRCTAARYFVRFPVVPKPVQPTPVVPTAESEILTFHRQAAFSLVARHGFWRPARLLREAADVYLSRREAGLGTPSLL